jgi:hypothetical protein
MGNKGGACTPCNSSRAINLFQTIVIFLVIIIIMIVMYYAVLRADGRLLAAVLADEALRYCLPIIAHACSYPRRDVMT